MANVDSNDDFEITVKGDVAVYDYATEKFLCDNNDLRDYLNSNLQFVKELQAQQDEGYIPYPLHHYIARTAELSGGRVTKAPKRGYNPAINA